MRRKLKIIIPIIITILIIIFLTIPMFEMKTEKKFFAIRYKENYKEFQKNSCYNKKYHYNKKYDISLTNLNHKKFLFFNFYSFDYKDGNVCKTEYKLEESYIKDFIEKAIITHNPANINIKQLIDGKTPIIGNSNYLSNDHKTTIEYTLNNKQETMYIFYQYELLIIQLGKSNEHPKFIAYK